MSKNVIDELVISAEKFIDCFKDFGLSDKQAKARDRLRKATARLSSIERSGLTGSVDKLRKAFENFSAASHIDCDCDEADSKEPELGEAVDNVVKLFEYDTEPDEDGKEPTI